jgi:hypothetical protein
MPNLFVGYVGAVTVKMIDFRKVEAAVRKQAELE